MGGVVKSIGNAVGGLLGGGGGGFTDGQRGVMQDPTKVEAWNIGKPLYQGTVTNTQNLMNEVFQNPAFTGQRVAGLDPFRSSGANALGTFNQSSVFPALGGLFSGAQGVASSGFGYGNNAQDIFNRASVDPTQQIINAAGQYANNPFVDGMIDAAGRDVTRNLFENQLTGIDRAASGTGNINSTRAGVESAIAKRGAADRLADMSSELRGRFFNQGLTMGQNQYNQSLRNMMGANEGLLQGFNSGFNALDRTQNLAAGGFDAMNTAGGVFQNQNQAELDAQRAQFDEALKNRMAMLGLGNTVSGGVGNSGSAVGTFQNQSGASNLGGLLTMAPQIGGLLKTGAGILGGLFK